LWHCSYSIYASYSIVQDGDDVPVNPTKSCLFSKIKFVVYTIFNEKLITVKYKSLGSPYKSNCDEQSIYTELTNHAKSSTKYHLSGYTLLTTSLVNNMVTTVGPPILYYIWRKISSKQIGTGECSSKAEALNATDTLGDIANILNGNQLSNHVVARDRIIMVLNSTLICCCQRFLHVTTRMLFFYLAKITSFLLFSGSIYLWIWHYCYNNCHTLHRAMRTLVEQLAKPYLREHSPYSRISQCT
jgi:hypothetical protein